MHFYQALIQSGESQGEPRFKISWSKASKKFGAEPVLEKKELQVPRGHAASSNIPG